MASAGETLVEGIDRTWLDDQARLDPVAHAWALWDLDHELGRFRIVSMVRGAAPVGYLLIWYASEIPRAHWVSNDPTDGLLALALPLPPVIAVVPERVAVAVADRLRTRDVRPLDVLACDGRSLTPPDPRVRRLRPADSSPLVEMIAHNPDVETTGYDSASRDLEHSLVWGAFEADRLVAVARVAVQLPSVWVITGVYTDPAFRGRGLGREVTAAATASALASGARATLNVRADNAAAQTIYREVGYKRVDRRMWVDASRGAVP